MREKIIKNITIVSFLFSLHLAFGLYISSSFLKSIDPAFFTNQLIGILYGISGILTILLIRITPKIFKLLKSSKFAVTLSLSIIMAIIINLAFFNANSIFVFVIFAFYQALNTLLAYFLDIFIEEYSEDNSTGKTRGTYLTFGNLATMISPVLVGIVMAKNDNNFPTVYLFAAFLVLSSLFFWIIKQKKITEITTQNKQTAGSLKKFLSKENRDLQIIFFINFMMQFFFSWMIIYMPILLNKEIGLSWATIGIVFTIMLAPFVLLQIPLGRLADNILGEKEIILSGIIFLSVSTLLIGLNKNDTIWLITLLLFLSRVGAGAIQIGTESYFFKKITAKEYGFIGIFRYASPLGYIAGPIIASLVLIHYQNQSLRFLFVILGILFSIPFFLTIFIKDTK